MTHSTGVVDAPFAADLDVMRTFSVLAVVRQAASTAIALLGLVGTAVASETAISDRAPACNAISEVHEPPFTVHGRLFAANGGGSGFRIWRIGSQRIFWISIKVEPPLPADVHAAFRGFDEELYGDFTLVAVQPERAGHMREVCLVSGANLVVRDVATGAVRKPRQ